MRHSVLDLEKRSKQRFCTALRYALCHARTDDEAAQALVLSDAVLAGHVSPVDAHAALSNLRRSQAKAA